VPKYACRILHEVLTTYSQEVEVEAGSEEEAFNAARTRFLEGKVDMGYPVDQETNLFEIDDVREVEGV